MTESIKRKSLNSNIITPPNRLEPSRKSFIIRPNASKTRLCTIVHSSQIMILHSRINFIDAEFLVIVHVGLSTVRRFIGNFKAECAVQPFSNNVAAMMFF
jgi:hypothetical protein